MTCNTTFYQCNIGNHKDHGRIWIPVEQNHDIANAIYYICDTSGQNIIAISITDHSYINHIHNKLSLTNVDGDDKVQLYCILISEYFKQAKSLQFHQHLLLLSKWQSIYKCYKARMKLPRDLTLIDLLGYCQCLIMLSKYSEVETLLLTILLVINEIDEIWYLLVKAQHNRKKEKYETYSLVKTTIHNALRLNKNNKEVKNEQAIIKKLIARRSQEEASANHDIDHRKT
ncbi:unnamed protein product [Rotaria sp. Silwood2]|nr:unnamed protein product [Rotaria sp. Silwood2]CAF3120824.1 unnamed protein product [Rotaria sp. Silwood2]CAF3415806.1 unnamed protein product [Rotaria sp. Silwood2]CAF4433177.1 unnamed protein product [Rotaria sp. Silwood2]CAF4471677.1 unnamed protein product [Rotaria sp. Silwood2]